MAEPDAIEALGWPLAQLGQGLRVLARRAGLPAAPADPAADPHGDPLANPGDWIEWVADRIELEAEAVAFPLTAFMREIAGTGPAVLQLGSGAGARFLLLLRAGRRTARLISPDLTEHRWPLADLRTAACAGFEAPLAAEIDRLMATASVAPRQRARVRAAMLRERLATRLVAGCWLLRLPATAPFAAHLVRAGLRWRMACVIATFLLLYGLEILGWVLIGEAALGGRLDWGWLAAWLLLVLSNVPLRLSSRWLNATFVLDIGRILKARLLAGALRMPVDAVRAQGVGQLLGRVIESQALESLALNGGIGMGVAVLKLGFAGWVLGAGAGGGWHVALLAGWLGLILALAWRFYRRLAAWSAQRLAMTNDLVERMVGHRTRLAQEWPARRDAEQDSALGDYVHVSRGLDDAMVPVAASAAGGWMLVGLIGLAPAFVLGAATPVGMAIGLGGILLAGRAFAGIAGGLAALARAVVAWGQVAPLFRAARPAAGASPFLPAPAASPQGSVLIDASDLVFRYRPGGEPVLRRLDLTVRHGERILLEGPSGGGKSTLAALLVGLRTPTSGLLLLDGLDRHTLGEAWHRLATAAPQFHENHILAGTLGFNLLMGRDWPASEEALEEARALCVALGLGDLLERMPAGMMQVVGETGWQLSHGERSRIFLARALLQGAELTILDESFAALDPETLRTCLDCAFERARTLIVIAHP